MEVRIAKMEKELAIMSNSLTSISRTLDKMSDIQTENRLLEEKYIHLDENLKESFVRVHNRQDKIENTTNWLIRILVGTVTVAVLKFTLIGGIV